jgi:hypothetical protein
MAGSFFLKAKVKAMTSKIPNARRSQMNFHRFFFMGARTGV